MRSVDAAVVCWMTIAIQLSSARRQVHLDEVFQHPVDDSSRFIDEKERSEVELDDRQVEGRKYSDCPADFTYMESVDGCYKIITEQLEWGIAQLRCRSLHKDGHLLVINDANEQKMVANLMSAIAYTPLSYCYFFPRWGFAFSTAGQRFDTSRADSTYVWKVPPNHGLMGTDMLEMKYTNWIAGQPNSSVQQPCVYISWRQQSYKWFDDSCYIKACTICEIDV